MWIKIARLSRCFSFLRSPAPGTPSRSVSHTKFNYHLPGIVRLRWTSRHPATSSQGGFRCGVLCKLFRFFYFFFFFCSLSSEKYLTFARKQDGINVQLETNGTWPLGGLFCWMFPVKRDPLLVHISTVEALVNRYFRCRRKSQKTVVVTPLSPLGLIWQGDWMQ